MPGNKGVATSDGVTMGRTVTGLRLAGLVQIDAAVPIYINQRVAHISIGLPPEFSGGAHVGKGFIAENVIGALIRDTAHYVFHTDRMEDPGRFNPNYDYVCQYPTFLK